MGRTIGSLFWLGFKKTLPFQTGVIPFGILYATLAINTGMPVWLILLFSIVVFGGSSQLVFIDLFKSLTPLQSALASNIVNGRHIIYSAGISEKFADYPKKWRLLLSYLLTDQLFAIAKVTNKSELGEDERLHPWFYFGSGFCTWIFWFISNFFGCYMGNLIPKSLNLDFSIPLMFMPLVFLTIPFPTAYVSCGLAIVCVFLFHDLPLGLGVLVSIVLSSFLTYWLIRFRKKLS